MAGISLRVTLSGLCILICLAVGANASAIDSDKVGAVDFVTLLGNRTVSMLSDTSLNRHEREAEFRRLLNEGFDLDTISRFALGRYWRRATNAERGEYRKLFEELIVSTYAARLGRYGGETFSVLEAFSEPNGGALVRTHILDSDFPPVRVDWRIRAVGESYRIVDVVLEGVSMALTQRDEFSSVIQKHGGSIEGLLNELRNKTDSN